MKTLTEEQAKQLLDYIKEAPDTPYKYLLGIRNTLMILLMLDAGLRVGEVVKLTRGVLCFAGQPVSTIVLLADKTKNKVERSIPVTDRLKAAIGHMIESFWEPAGVKAENLAFRSGCCTGCFSVRQVERLIAYYSEAAIGFRIHPHVLRHTFATRLMKKTNIRIVQKLLGHKRLTSTQVYTHPDAEDLKKAIGELNDRIY